MNILIVGCGNLGSRLADVLCHHGHNVSIVDTREDSFHKLSDDFDGMTITGMPMDLTVLRNAGIEGCDAVAAVSSDDNLNITVSQIVIEFFGIKNVVTRINDPAREKVFCDFGMKTICQTKLSCEAVFSSLMNDVKYKQLTFGNSTLSFQVKNVDNILIGRSLDAVPKKYGEVILGVLKDNGQVILFDSKQKIVLNSGDKIIHTKIVDTII